MAVIITPSNIDYTPQYDIDFTPEGDTTAVGTYKHIQEIIRIYSLLERLDLIKLNIADFSAWYDAVFSGPNHQLPGSTLVDLSVTNNKLAPNSVTTDKILDGTILERDLSNGIVSITKAGADLLALIQAAQNAATAAQNAANSAQNAANAAQNTANNAQNSANNAQNTANNALNGVGSGNAIAVKAVNSSYTLPGGGTWAVFSLNVMTGDAGNEGNFNARIAAGGTTISGGGGFDTIVFAVKVQ